MRITAVTAVLLLVALTAGCASGQVRGLTSQVRGHVQSNNLSGLAEVLDAQTPEIREQVFYEAPEARDPYARWKAMTPDEQEAARHSFALTDELAAPPAPEATFSEPPEVVHAKLIELCATSNLAIVETNPNMIVCEGRAGLGNALAHALFAPAYSSPAKENIRFVIYKSGVATKVRMSGWIESQSAFGQVNRTEMTSANHMRAFKQILVRAGGE